MKPLGWMPSAGILFLLLFLRFQPSKAGAVGRNTTAINNGAAPIDGPPGDNMASTSATVNKNLENPTVTGLNGSHEEPCEQIPEHDPPILFVIHSEKTSAEVDLLKKFKLDLGIDGEAPEVEDEEGISIICSADYPIYLEFLLNDGSFNYFFKPDRNYCKCESEDCNLLFMLGIWIPTKVWNSLEEAKLVFNCKSISGRAMMYKNAVVTQEENSTHNVEILTIFTEQLETSMMQPTSNGRASVRIGKCQLDSHGDHGFLADASEKIPSCTSEVNTENGTTPCLTEIIPVQQTETEGNASVKTKPSPFLDMAILEDLICCFDSDLLLYENTKESGYTCNTGGLETEPKIKETSPCCSDCWLVVLSFSFVFTVPVCWLLLIRVCCLCKDDDVLLASTRMVPVDAERAVSKAEAEGARVSSMHVKWKVYSLIKQ